MMFDRYVVAAFMLLVILNGADCITTMIGLRLGAREVNRIPLILIQNLGVIGTLLLKFYLVVCLGLFALFAHSRSSLNPWFYIIGFGSVIVYYIFVVFNNLQVIWKLWGS